MTQDKANLMTERRQDLIAVAIISDLHVEFDYLPGSSNKCGDILCCRSRSGAPKSQEDVAGFWGDYRCDIPVYTLESMLGQIRDQIKPDAVFWLGDSISHNVGTLSAE